jgi:GNAT superfamily N-acetyltransferase
LSNIRPAVESDIPRMVDMGVKFNEQSPYSKHLKISREKVAAMGKQLIDANGLLVSERDGQIVGMIGFIVHNHFMSGETVAGEVFWWVEPEFRGDGLRLLKEAEKRAREAGAKKMHMIAPTDQVATVYERVGYDFVESTFQKSL